MLAKSSQGVSRNLGPVRIPTREGTVGMVLRESGQLPPLEITCHSPSAQTHLFCSRSVAGEVWEWFFRAGVEARGLPKAPAPQALGSPVQAPPCAIGGRSNMVMGAVLI